MKRGSKPSAALATTDAAAGAASTGMSCPVAVYRVPPVGFAIVGEQVMKPVLEARGLGRRFGRRWVLAHVDLELAAGRSLLVVGPNGCGKTTLLRLLAGGLEASAGSVRLFGLDPRRHRAAVRAAAMRGGCCSAARAIWRRTWS